MTPLKPTALCTALRRLGQARPGPGVLQLPDDLTPAEALQAIQAVLAVLDPPAPPPVSSKRAGREASVCIHTDGGARGNPGPAGIGVVLAKPDGQVVDRIHRYIGEATNNVAEYLALLAGLDRAQELGYRDVEVLSDSELLVRQLEGRYQVRHPKLRPLFEAARERIAGFEQFHIRHVPRAENAEADALANRGIDEGRRPRRAPPASGAEP
jgi:ribonuclease HI